jgi:hypothetical protein
MSFFAPQYSPFGLCSLVCLLVHFCLFIHSFIRYFVQVVYLFFLLTYLFIHSFIFLFVCLFVQVVEDLKDESEPFRKMVMETIEKVLSNLGAADIPQSLEDRLIDGACNSARGVGVCCLWCLVFGVCCLRCHLYPPNMPIHEDMLIDVARLRALLEVFVVIHIQCLSHACHPSP